MKDYYYCSLKGDRRASILYAWRFDEILPLAKLNSGLKVVRI